MRSCGTVAKAGGNREHKLRPVVTEGSYLLERPLSAKQKNLSLRPWRLRGENVILDKYDTSYNLV